MESKKIGDFNKIARPQKTMMQKLLDIEVNQKKPGGFEYNPAESAEVLTKFVPDLLKCSEKVFNFLDRVNVIRTVITFIPFSFDIV